MKDETEIQERLDEINQKLEGSECGNMALWKEREILEWVLEG